jgi:hypothetical protein
LVIVVKIILVPHCSAGNIFFADIVFIGNYQGGNTHGGADMVKAVDMFSKSVFEIHITAYLMVRLGRRAGMRVCT